MKNNAKNNVIMLVVTALILIAVNVGVWLAAERGVIAPIDNVVVWGTFVGLNVVSLLWAVSLLGLQPLVVTLSYLVGCGIAFMGVRGMDGVNMAEVMTAGATYGAFGVLAVGHATTKVRLAFFNKGQVPFALVMAGLLVVDGLLNSRISQAGVPVLLNAVVYPFVLAGVVPGLLLMASRRRETRAGIGEMQPAVAAVAKAETANEQSEVHADPVVVEPLPKEPVDEPIERPRILPAEPPAEAIPCPVMAEDATVKPAVEEVYIPFEIDGREDDETQFDDGGLLDGVTLAGEEEDETFLLPAFDMDEFKKSTGAISGDSSGGVMVEETVVAVPAEEDRTARAESTTAEEPPPKKDDDWLNSHLNLLSKLK